MADANAKAWRERLVALAMLVWGKVGDVAAFIDRGEANAAPKSAGVPISPDVARHMAAIEKAGRFVMPDEVDNILGPADGTHQTQGDESAATG